MNRNSGRKRMLHFNPGFRVRTYFPMTAFSSATSWCTSAPCIIAPWVKVSVANPGQVKQPEPWVSPLGPDDA